MTSGKFRDRWHADMIINNKKIYIGTCFSEHDAHVGYLTRFKQEQGILPAALNPLNLEVS